MLGWKIIRQPSSPGKKQKLYKKIYCTQIKTRIHSGHIGGQASPFSKRSTERLIFQKQANSSFSKNFSRTRSNWHKKIISTLIAEQKVFGWCFFECKKILIFYCLFFQSYFCNQHILLNFTLNVFIPNLSFHFFLRK